MDVLFIRHAEAVEACDWGGPDLTRPLTRDGIRGFRALARRAAAWYGRPDRLICSEAVRAWETAALLRGPWPRLRVEKRPELNPGARPPAIRRLLREAPAARRIVLVGHEPDFSTAVADMVSGGALRMKLRKGGIAVVRWAPGRRAELRALLAPEHGR